MDISTLAGKIQLCYSTTELAQVETDLTMTSREIADLYRDMVRIETRLCKLAIALGQEKVLGNK